MGRGLPVLRGNCYNLLPEQQDFDFLKHLISNKFNGACFIPSRL